jgi:F-type H+-transporting ATPase subunit delta
MGAIANRYARAFADVVLERNLDSREVSGQLAGVVDLYRSNLDLRRVWESPAISAEQKRKLLDAIAQRSGLLQPVRNFLAVLLDHGRIRQLELIARQFQTELNNRLGIVEAEVTTARAMQESERAELLAQVASLTGKQVSAEYRIDPALIGGVTIRLGSTIYDGSVSGQLEKIKELLSAG